MTRTTPFEIDIPLNCSSLAGQIETACILEAAARKPGNVHPEASFVDLTFDDFVRAARICAPILARSRESCIGNTILQAVQACVSEVKSNSNLGIILLLAPLAAVPENLSCGDGIATVLSQLTMHDTEQIYDAIRIAQPGGLGQSAEQDISQRPTVGIVEAMSLAANRDLVARQYVNGFDDVLSFGRSVFLEEISRQGDWESGIIRTQLEFMSRNPDSLIARKCGLEIAVQSQQLAQSVLDTWLKEGRNSEQTSNGLRNFDQWLRADGHRRNPGTTADLIAAVLFAVIRDDLWKPPYQVKGGGGKIDLSKLRFDEHKLDI